MEVKQRQRRTASTRVADSLRNRINAGEYPAGSVLPPQRSIATHYKVAAATTENAIKQLVSEGLLRTEIGRGTFVESSVASQPVQDISYIDARAPELPVSAAPPVHVGILVGYGSEAVRQADGAELGGPAVTALEDYVSQRGGSSTVYGFETRFGNRDGADVIEALDVLASKGANAIAICRFYWTDALGVTLEDYHAERVPLVYQGVDAHRFQLPQVYFDGRFGARQAARHLLKQGCRRLMYFSTTPQEMEWVINRAAGVRDAVRNMADAQVKECILPGGLLPIADPLENRQGLEFAEATLEHSEFPEGVIASNDYAAIAFKQVAEKRGYIAGKDYLLVGFDDKSQARAEGISTVRWPTQGLARETARLLADLPDNPHTVQRVCVPMDLVVRESSRHTMTGARQKTRRQK